ncbi:MAG: LysR family transcriptional regulator [Planctomycetota bacterium]
MTLPDLDSLECFEAAARLLNFRAASQAVSLTPAALGKRIAQLESQLGRKLFHRTTRKVELTEAGLALVPRARELLAQGRECVRAVRGETGPPPMELTLGTRHELGLSWIVPMLGKLKETLPQVTLHLYFSSGPDLERRVRTTDIDCAVISRAAVAPLMGERLHREDYVFVGSPKLLARQPLVKDEQAVFHTLVDVHRELNLFNYWRDAQGGGERLQFGRVLVMGTIAAIRMLVLAGEGVAVLPLYLVQQDLEKKKLQTIFPDVTPRSDWFRLLHREDDPRRAIYQALARTMNEVPLA